MSEKLYWLILIAAFTGFGLLTWVWLIPDGIVEYNLGVNLLTSSVFMVFTIVFLSWLSRLREELQWKLARDQLHQELGARLFSISRQIFLLIDQALTGEMPQIAFVKRLEELCDGSEENLRQTVEMAFMQSERDINHHKGLGKKRPGFHFHGNAQLSVVFCP